MAKRRTKRKAFVTQFPNHHEPLDPISRRLIGSSHRRLERVAERILAKAGFFESEPEPTVEYRGELYHDVAVPAEAIVALGLRPTWVGRP
jgi:hypothetical protein